MAKAQFGKVGYPAKPMAVKPAGKAPAKPVMGKKGTGSVSPKKK